MDHQYLVGLTRGKVVIEGCGAGASGTNDRLLPIPKWARFAYVIGRSAGAGGGGGATGAASTVRGGGGGGGKGNFGRLLLPVEAFNGVIGIRLGGYGTGGAAGVAGVSNEVSYLFIPNSFPPGFPSTNVYSMILNNAGGGGAGTTTGGSAGFLGSGAQAATGIFTTDGNQASQGGATAGGTANSAAAVSNLDWMNTCGGAGGGGVDAGDIEYNGGDISVRSPMMLQKTILGGLGGGGGSGIIDGGNGVWDDNLLFGTGGAGGGGSASGTGGAGGNGAYGCGGGGGGAGLVGGKGGDGGQARFDFWWIP